MKDYSLKMAGLLSASAVFVFALSIICGTMLFARPGKNSQKAEINTKAEEATPVEDLMREHGVLRRIMLICEKEESVLDKGESPRYDVIFKSANIIQDFVEAYHEKLEEDQIFPIFEKAGQMTDLTMTLREQHAAGRKLTQTIMRLSKERRTGDKEDPGALAGAMRSFIRMYRPHAAREDTVLFQALRGLISENEYRGLGDRFEDREHELFGENGFEGKVKEVTALEKELDLYELSQFTAAK